MESLTKHQVGQRIVMYRKMKGFSQEELSARINLSRPSLAKIESGSRSLSVLELQRIALVLEFSVDEFLSRGLQMDEEPDQVASHVPIDGRIATVPDFQPHKFKHVLLYILERCAGKPNVGETVLCKMLYFSDFNYYELYKEYLTGAVYKKFPYGPVPSKFGYILWQMIGDHQIQRIKCRYQGYSQTRYIPLQKADLTLFKASEKEVIDKVLEQLSDMPASAISAYSHKDMPWRVSCEGREIDYQLAFQREPPYSVRSGGLQE